MCYLKKVGEPTKGQHWRSECYKELQKLIGQFSRVVMAPTAEGMFVVLSNLAGLPEPLTIGSSFKTLPAVNTVTGQMNPRVVEFDDYPGWDGQAQKILPPDHLIKDCKKIGIYGTTEGQLVCVSLLLASSSLRQSQGRHGILGSLSPMASTSLPRCRPRVSWPVHFWDSH